MLLIFVTDNWLLGNWKEFKKYTRIRLCIKRTCYWWTTWICTIIFGREYADVGRFIRFIRTMVINSSFLLLSRCLFNSKNKPVCQEHPENLNVHLLLIIRLIFNSTKITFFNIVWDTPSITVTAILYFTSISTFSGGLAKSLSISCSSTSTIFAIVSLDMPW